MIRQSTTSYRPGLAFGLCLPFWAFLPGLCPCLPLSACRASCVPVGALVLSLGFYLLKLSRCTLSGSLWLAVRCSRAGWCSTFFALIRCICGISARLDSIKIWENQQQTGHTNSTSPRACSMPRHCTAAPVRAWPPQRITRAARPPCYEIEIKRKPGFVRGTISVLFGTAWYSARVPASVYKVIFLVLYIYPNSIII